MGVCLVGFGCVGDVVNVYFSFIVLSMSCLVVESVLIRFWYWWVELSILIIFVFLLIGVVYMLLFLLVSGWVGLCFLIVCWFLCMIDWMLIVERFVCLLSCLVKIVWIGW